MVDLLLFEFSVFMFSMFFRINKLETKRVGMGGGGGGGGGAWVWVRVGLVLGTGKNCHP